MARYTSYYSPKLPLYIVRKIQQLGYNPDTFIEWFVKFPDLEDEVSNYRKELTRTNQVLVGLGYYFWFFYVISALIILLFSPIVGLVAFAISPFVTVGVLYGAVYCLWHIKYKKLDSMKRDSEAISSKPTKKPKKRK